MFFVIATAVNVTQFMSNGSFSVAADASGVSAYTVVGNIISALTVQQVEPERRGVAAGTFSLAYDVGFMIGPAIAGFLVTKIGYSSMFLWCVAPCVLCLCLLALYWKKLTAVDNH